MKRTHQPLAALLLLMMATFASGDVMPVRGVTLAHLHRGDRGYGSDACRAQLDAVKAIDANWIAINPYAYMRSVNEPGVSFDNDPTMSRAAQLKAIADAHTRGLSVMVKPHVWSGGFSRGQWHGDIAMKSERDWDAWFSDYTSYILFNARLAQEAGAEALCIGNELEGTTQQTARWRVLIAKVRSVYQGKVTYAAAFMEWRKIEFWGDLDCVGINAYWKLSDAEHADDAQIRAGWKTVYDELDDAHRQMNLPVCFTEIGYSLSSTAAMEPWSYVVREQDPALQQRLFRIAIEEAERRPYVVGMFLWKWFSADTGQGRGREAFDLTNATDVQTTIRNAWRVSAR